MSKSNSPCITQFFKAQRKRPRTIGKEDAEVPSSSTTKKLILEDGIIAQNQNPLTKDGSFVEEREAPGKSTQVEEDKETKEEDKDIPPRKIAIPVKFVKVSSLSPTKRKTLSSDQVTKLLKKKSKLKELKTALDGLNQCARKIDEFRRTVAEANAQRSPAKEPVKEEPGNNGAVTATLDNTPEQKAGIPPAQFYPPKVDSVNLDHLSSGDRPLRRPTAARKIKTRLFDNEDKQKILPAYQRFHTLAQKTPAETNSAVEDPGLPLPYHFKVLEELFLAVETVTGMMKRRKETILFPKLREGVLELFRKTLLREKHLAQMATVLPGCYSFELEKVGLTGQIRVNVEELLPSVVCARRKAFHAALIKICLEHHQEFLLGLAPPIIVQPEMKITRWHPRFRIDQIPDIIPEKAALPTKPTPHKISTAREVIAQAQNILENANPRMKNAVTKMLNNKNKSNATAENDVGGGGGGLVKNSNDLENCAKCKSTSNSSAKIRALKGVSSSLLEKIRNRERQKLLTEITRSPADSKQLKMTKRLPSFIKIIRNMMVSEKKVALAMDLVVDRLSHSVQDIAIADVETHLRLLVTLLPNWIKIHKLSHSSMEYVRIEKTTDINLLLAEMNDIIKQFKV